MNNVHIDGLGLRKVNRSLNARVQHDAVEIGVAFGNTGSSEYQASEIYPSANFVTKFGILSSSVMSKGTAVDLSLPCS